MANPPITIGELTTVPAPLSPVNSPWAQQISARIVQRFATKAALDAGWPSAAGNKGAIAVTLDTVTLWKSSGTAWLPVGPRGMVASHTLTTAFVTTGTHTNFQDEGLLATVDEESGRVYRFTLIVNPWASGGANGIRYTIIRGGATVRTWDIPSEALSVSASHAVTLSHVYTAPANFAGAQWRSGLQALNANTAVTSQASATFPRQLIAENIA